MKEPGVSIVGVQQIDHVVEVRKNKFVEKHLNFHLQTQPVKTVVPDGVKETRLISEDAGARGCDIGVNLPILLNAIVAELPSDASTMAMNREYTVNVFRTVVDTLTELVPEMQIATDINCRFPGTPAARMKKVPSNVVKQQSRELTSILEAFTPYSGMEGRVERIWKTDRNRLNSLDEIEISK
ncbi:hypothetical protein POTOM_059388 [Populus tomentosa]|uniref:Uncharacterized protein n=1 Tax=Populus tomentosa TaxID=118781 RepID=A0A8X8C1J6_POPTO|nr:hypothetical protein POTOM_059388 [Populus tomentosa]